MAEEEKRKIFKKMESQLIPDDVLEAMSLKNRYAFLNANLMAVLTDDEKKYIDKVQRFCVKYERKNNIDHSEDFYKWIPDFGAEHYITRGQPFPEIGIEHGDNDGLMADFLRCAAIDMFDPQFNMAMGATVLCINPVKHHHENREPCLQALKDMVTGQAAGCICITEPTKGSDATHLDTIAKRSPEGLHITGVKCYNTNGPKSKYAVVYGTEDPSAPDADKRMSQSLVVLPDPSVKVERSYIPSVPRIFIGKETFTNTLVPNDRILCDVGKGKGGLFEGLVPERMGIAALDVCEAWSALTFATIYTNLRKQMGQEIIKHQGVGFLVADYWAQTMNFTLAIIQFCRSYDAAIKQYNGHLPPALNMALVASSSQLKYQGAILAERCCYEMANVMGGGGVNDNTLMQDLLGVSRIQEIVGGSRQIQLYLMQVSLRKLWQMSK